MDTFWGELGLTACVLVSGTLALAVLVIAGHFVYWRWLRIQTDNYRTRTRSTRARTDLIATQRRSLDNSDDDLGY